MEQLSPQDAWEQLSSEGDYNTQQAFKAFRKFEAAALHRVLFTSQKALEESLENEPDMVQDNVLMLQHLLGFSMVDAVLLHLAAVASQSKRGTWNVAGDDNRERVRMGPPCWPFSYRSRSQQYAKL